MDEGGDGDFVEGITTCLVFISYGSTDTAAIYIEFYRQFYD